MQTPLNDNIPQDEQSDAVILEFSQTIQSGETELNCTIELIVEDEAWLTISNDFEFAGKAALLALAQSPAINAIKSTHRLAVVLLSNNANVRELNKTYRGMDKPTNVLSFPVITPEISSSDEEFIHDDDENHIGDAILAYDYVVNEAKEDEKQLEHHISHLIIHGVLHLLGYDHENDEQAETMETLEKQLMNKLGLPDPY